MTTIAQLPVLRLDFTEADLVAGYDEGRDPIRSASIDGVPLGDFTNLALRLTGNELPTVTVTSEVVVNVTTFALIGEEIHHLSILGSHFGNVKILIDGEPPTRPVYAITLSVGTDAPTSAVIAYEPGMHDDCY